MITSLLVLMVSRSIAADAGIPAARIDPAEPASPEELDAAERYERRACGLGWGWAWPGVSRFCLHRPVEGALLGGLAAAEVAAAGALLVANPVPSPTDGGPGLPLVGFQNLYITGLGLSAIDGARSRNRPYTPKDDLGDLIAAPFRPAVLGKPGVWLGGGLLTAGAVALTVATEDFQPSPKPNLFGADLEPEVAYPLAAVVDVTAFLHVAIGEEVLFRGVLQSAFTRGTDPVAGWLLGSAVFGAVHLTNAIGLPADDRLAYVLVSVPYITLTGAWLGHVYRTYRYSLAPSVAIHFWYDAVLGGLAYALDPDDNLFSARVTVPF